MTSRQIHTSDKIASQNQLLHRIKTFQREFPENRRCAVCNDVGATYICVDFGTFVCTPCSGVHREFNLKVKGISVSTWSPEEVESILARGNKVCANKYFAEWKEEDKLQAPQPGNTENIRVFLKAAFIEERWTRHRTQQKRKTQSSRKTSTSQEYRHTQKPFRSQASSRHKDDHRPSFSPRRQHGRCTRKSELISEGGDSSNVHRPSPLIESSQNGRLKQAAQFRPHSTNPDRCGSLSSSASIDSVRHAPSQGRRKESFVSRNRVRGAYNENESCEASDLSDDQSDRFAKINRRRSTKGKVQTSHNIGQHVRRVDLLQSSNNEEDPFSSMPAKPIAFGERIVKTSSRDNTRIDGALRSGGRVAQDILCSLPSSPTKSPNAMSTDEGFNHDVLFPRHAMPITQSQLDITTSHVSVQRKICDDPFDRVFAEADTLPPAPAPPQISRPAAVPYSNARNPLTSLLVTCEPSTSPFPPTLASETGAGRHLDVSLMTAQQRELYYSLQEQQRSLNMKMLLLEQEILRRSESASTVKPDTPSTICQLDQFSTVLPPLASKDRTTATMQTSRRSTEVLGSNIIQRENNIDYRYAAFNTLETGDPLFSRRNSQDSANDARLSPPRVHRPIISNPSPIVAHRLDLEDNAPKSAASDAWMSLSPAAQRQSPVLIGNASPPRHIESSLIADVQTLAESHPPVFPSPAEAFNLCHHGPSANDLIKISGSFTTSPCVYNKTNGDNLVKCDGVEHHQGLGEQPNFPSQMMNHNERITADSSPMSAFTLPYDNLNRGGTNKAIAATETLVLPSTSFHTEDVLF